MMPHGRKITILEGTLCVWLLSHLWAHQSNRHPPNLPGDITVRELLYFKGPKWIPQTKAPVKPVTHPCCSPLSVCSYSQSSTNERWDNSRAQWSLPALQDWGLSVWRSETSAHHSSVHCSLLASTVYSIQWPVGPCGLHQSDFSCCMRTLLREDKNLRNSASVLMLKIRKSTLTGTQSSKDKK